MDMHTKSLTFTQVELMQIYNLILFLISTSKNVTIKTAYIYVLGPIFTSEQYLNSLQIIQLFLLQLHRMDKYNF